MEPPTEDRIAQLLGDPACPRARGARVANVVPVLPFIAFARSRGVATGELEVAMDAYVERVGGQRQKVTDPWSWLPNLVRRVSGRLPSPSGDVWLLSGK